MILSVACGRRIEYGCKRASRVQYHLSELTPVLEHLLRRGSFGEREPLVYHGREPPERNEVNDVYKVSPRGVKHRDSEYRQVLHDNRAEIERSLPPADYADKQETPLHLKRLEVVLPDGCAYLVENHVHSLVVRYFFYLFREIS